MCGIAGIYNMSTHQPVRSEHLEAMIATMPHRGPDAQATLLMDDRTGFGHARLAILDLAPESNQPFQIDRGDYSITYNGEIFNYIELREELEMLGHRFRTKSDTEVLIRSYAVWGEDCVRRFNGMWGFSIYDRARDILFCSRDRFGIKPFNYVQCEGQFLFGSEIKALLAVVSGLAEPNYDALSMLLRASHGAHLQQTCFQRVLRLPPAHNLIVTRDSVSLKRYWDYPTDTYDDIHPDEAAKQIRQHLIDALRLRMRSDVPVGTTLSSGVDSSTVVCLLRTFYEGQHETFTAKYSGKQADESAQAERLSRSLNMDPNSIPAFAGEFLPQLRQVVRHLESPHYSPATMLVWNIMASARKKVTVVLEGQGSDELLAG